MEISRRKFVQTTGQCLALGAAASTGLGKVFAQSTNQAAPAKKIKMIVRVDDVGYTDVVNIGTFKAIDAGIPTAADVMFDCPGTVDALERLRKRPWLTIGWHAHMWGKPILPASKVSSLVGPDGHFKWSMRDGTALVGTNFAHADEWAKLEDQIVYEEAVAEFRAEIERCVRIAGRPPFTAGFMGPNTLVQKAKNQVAQEFGMKSGFIGSHGAALHYMGKERVIPPRVPSPEYADIGIYEANRTGKGGSGEYAFETPRPFEAEKYNPMNDFLNNVDNFEANKITMFVFHPGFLDDYIVTDGGITISFNRTRPLDVALLCSPELHDWMKTHNVELMSTKDALTGSRDFQTHLKQISSDLYVG